MPTVFNFDEHRLGSCRNLCAVASVAWPTVHGHSWVQHPGRGRLPGHMVAVGTILLQIVVLSWLRPLFLFVLVRFVGVFGFGSPSDLFSGSCAL